jgi:hypothetical protein
VSGNRVLRRIFGPERAEVIGGWRKLHNEDLHNLHSSPSIFRMIKLRRIRWAGYVARKGRRGCIQDFGLKSRRKEITRKT